MSGKAKCSLSVDQTSFENQKSMSQMLFYSDQQRDEQGWDQYKSTCTLTHMIQIHRWPKMRSFVAGFRVFSSAVLVVVGIFGFCLCFCRIVVSISIFGLCPLFLSWLGSHLWIVSDLVILLWVRIFGFCPACNRWGHRTENQLVLCFWLNTAMLTQSLWSEIFRSTLILGNSQPFCLSSIPHDEIAAKIQASSQQVSKQVVQIRRSKRTASCCVAFPPWSVHRRMQHVCWCSKSRQEEAPAWGRYKVWGSSRQTIYFAATIQTCLSRSQKGKEVSTQQNPIFWIALC